MKYLFSINCILALMLINPQLLNAGPLPVFKISEFKFASTDYKLAINFPGEFEQTVSSKEDNGSKLYTLEVSCTIAEDLYMATATKHVLKLDEPLRLAGVSLKSFAEALNGEIKKQSTYTYKTHQGIEALIYLTDLNVYAHYRVLLAGNIQYQIVVIDGAETLSGKADSFFRSFEIL